MSIDNEINSMRNIGIRRVFDYDYRYSQARFSNELQHHNRTVAFYKNRRGHRRDNDELCAGSKVRSCLLRGFWPMPRSHRRYGSISGRGSSKDGHGGSRRS